MWEIKEGNQERHLIKKRARPSNLKEREREKVSFYLHKHFMPAVLHALNYHHQPTNLKQQTTPHIYVCIRYDMMWYKIKLFEIKRTLTEQSGRIKSSQKY
jgi:hypothetical protein